MSDSDVTRSGPSGSDRPGGSGSAGAASGWRSVGASGGMTRSGARKLTRLARFDVLGLAGKGGMGLVYRVRDPETGVIHALKVLDTYGRTEERRETMRARFEREGHAIAQVGGHGHIGRVHEAGRLDDGSPYLLLAWLPGGSLKERIGGKPMAPAEAFAIARDLARALDFIHEKGYVHRDFKPSNVMFDESGAPRLTDFGLVRILESEPGSPALTKSGAAVGTPLYMAPEQAKGEKDVGAAADVWALGAVLYEMLTGRPPFMASSPAEQYIAIVKHDPPPPSTVVDGLPRGTDAVVARAMRKTAGERYRRASDLAKDLERLRRGESVSVQTPALPPRRQAALAIGVGVAVVVAAAAGATIALSGGGGQAGASGVARGSGAADRPVPEASAEAALEAGDYTRMLGPGRLEPDGTRRIARALALFVGEADAVDAAAPPASGPDPVGALVELRRARQPAAAVAVLRAELLTLLADEEAALAILDARELTGEPLVLAQRARVLRDGGQDTVADKILERARAAAAPRGLREAVERIHAGSVEARALLAEASERAGTAAGRSGRGEARRLFERLTGALASRDPESGRPDLARAHERFAAGDDRGAIEAASRALDRRLEPEATGVALVLRARARLVLGVATAGAQDAHRAIEFFPADSPERVDARLLAVEADIARADGDEELLEDAIGDARRGATAARRIPETRPRPWLGRQLRAKVLEARGLAAAGRFSAAADLADQVAREAFAAVTRWDEMLRLRDLDATVARDPDDITATAIRAAVRLRHDIGSETWRSGIVDTVRIAKALPQSVLFARAIRHVPEHWSVGYTNAAHALEPDGADATPLDRSRAALAQAVEAFLRAGGADRERLEAAERDAAAAIAFDASDPGAWLLGCLVADAHRRSEVAIARLEVARALAPDVAESEALRLLLGEAADEGRGRRLVDRLVLAGADPAWIRTLDVDLGGRLLQAGGAERVDELSRWAGGFQLPPRLLTVDHQVKERLAIQEELAALDGGDDGTLWHLIGTARFEIAQRARMDAQAGRADRARDAIETFGRAAAAFARAAERSGEPRRQLHESAEARALVFSRRDAGQAAELFERSIERLDELLPRGRRPLVFGELGGLFIPPLTEPHLFAHNRWALRSHRALARLQLGDPEGARDDAERAATEDAVQATVLAQVYRTLAGR